MRAREEGEQRWLAGGEQRLANGTVAHSLARDHLLTQLAPASQPPIQLLVPPLCQLQASVVFRRRPGWLALAWRQVIAPHYHLSPARANLLPCLAVAASCTASKSHKHSAGLCRVLASSLRSPELVGFALLRPPRPIPTNERPKRLTKTIKQQSQTGKRIRLHTIDFGNWNDGRAGGQRR